MECFPDLGTVAEFVEGHLLPNEPCLFEEQATRDWGARINWVKQDGTPNFDYLNTEFGTYPKASIQIYNSALCLLVACPF